MEKRIGPFPYRVEVRRIEASAVERANGVSDLQNGMVDISIDIRPTRVAHDSVTASFAIRARNRSLANDLK
ncbi:MAG: hypothetical protein BGN84_07800 [Afipia sp. 62-7]|nr:MAG: hypothetical protein BGN84_07800 [Afipia sp. 62-7]